MYHAGNEQAWLGANEILFTSISTRARASPIWRIQSTSHSVRD